MPTARDNNGSEFVRAVLVVLFLSPSAVAADEPLAETKKQEGVSLFMEERYPEALAAFQASYRLVPNPTALFNIAMCEKALFLYVDSIATFRKYLSEADDEIDDARKAEVASQIAEMEMRVSRLDIGEAPDGATISIDGKPAATAPLASPVLLNPGRHVVEVKRDEYKPFRKEVEAANGREILLSANLKRLETVLRVDCDDPNAIIRVDGSPAGGCPFNEEIAAGDHELRVEAPGKVPIDKRVNVPAFGVTTISLNLLPAKPAATSVSIEEETPSVDTTDTPGKAKRIAGWSLIGLGAASAAVGGAFTGVYFHNRGIAWDAQDRHNADPPPEGYTADDSRDDVDTFNEYNDKLPGNKAAMAAGYVSAGVCIAAGTVLLLLSRKRVPKESGVTWKPSGAGFRATF